MSTAARAALITAQTLMCAALVGCAAAPPTPTATMSLAPGQAPVSLAGDEVHRRWGAPPNRDDRAPEAQEVGAEPVNEGSQGDPEADPTRSKLNEGFLNVQRSADQCLSRAMKRDGEVPVSKVRVRLRIKGDGRVERLALDDALDDSIFGRCLKSHTDRWRFAAWEGAPVEVTRIFVFQ